MSTASLLLVLRVAVATRSGDVRGVSIEEGDVFIKTESNSLCTAGASIQERCQLW